MSTSPAPRLRAVPAEPQVAARLRGVRSSPVRDILALTARPGVISFAGGLPAPELFDAVGLGVAFADALADARPHAAVLDHRGRPGSCAPRSPRG